MTCNSVTGFNQELKEERGFVNVYLLKWRRLEYKSTRHKSTQTYVILVSMTSDK